MAFSRPWSLITPADGDAASAGAGEIRNLRDDFDDRLMTGSGSGGLIDLTGTRTVDTDPMEIGVGKIDTATLEAGAIGAVGRASTYFGLTTLARGGASVAHTGATAILQNQWENVTGAQITIPNTVLNTTGVIEHTNGAAITSSDYVIFLLATFVARINGTNGTSSSDASVYRLYNTTNATVVSQGDNGALGAAAVHGVWTLDRGTIGNNNNAGQSMLVIGRDTGRTTTTVYDLQFAAVSATGGVPLGVASIPEVRIAIADLRLYALVFKR